MYYLYVPADLNVLNLKLVNSEFLSDKLRVNCTNRIQQNAKFVERYVISSPDRSHFQSLNRITYSNAMSIRVDNFLRSRKSARRK